MVPYVLDNFCGIQTGEFLQRRIFVHDFLFVQEHFRMPHVFRSTVVAVEALVLGREFFFVPKVPLAHHQRLVPCPVALLGDRDFVGVQAKKPMSFSIAIDPHIEPTPLRIRSRQKSGSSGTADRRGGVKVSKLQTLPSQAINIGRRNCFGSVATNVAVSHVVHQDENDVRLVN